MNKRLKIYILILIFFIAISIGKTVEAAWIGDAASLDDAKYPRLQRKNK